MKETLRRKEAFELYYKMGNDRTLEKLSKVVGVTEDTLKKWSSGLDWKEKIKDRGLVVGQRLEERNIEEEVNTRVLLNTATNESIELYRKMLKNKDSISVENAKVLDILGRLWKELETQVETVSDQPQGVNENINAPIFNLNFNKNNKPEDYDNDDGSYEEDGDDFEEETAEEELEQDK